MISPAPAICPADLSWEGLEGTLGSVTTRSDAATTGALTSYICRQSEVGIVVRSSIAVLARYLLPDLRVDWREQRIPIGRNVHMGNLQSISHRHGCSKNIAAAYHHDFIDPTSDCIAARKAECRIEARGQHGARCDKTQIAREHDVCSTVKHLPDGLKGLATHDHRTIESKL